MKYVLYYSIIQSAVISVTEHWIIFDIPNYKNN